MKKHILPLLLFFIFYALGQAQFVEKGKQVGIEHIYKSNFFISSGVGVLDVNNDDLLDLFIIGGVTSSALYINNGDGFDKSIVYLSLEDIDFYDVEETGVGVGDVNNDGYDDLFITTIVNQTNLLLINNQDNTFDAIPDSLSGIADSSWGISASFGDVNKDGLLDIFVANYIKEYNFYEIGDDFFLDHIGHNNVLYLNKGNNQFEEVGERYGLNERGNTLAAAFTDYDMDNDMDLYVVNDFGQFVESNELFENQYPSPQFKDVSVESGANIELFGMGLAIGDYDNDLDLDYYMTNIAKNVLIKNDGNKSFAVATDEAMVGDSSVTENGASVGWGTGFFDYNNDGWLDLYVSNGFLSTSSLFPNPIFNPISFYENNADGTFTNIAATMGFIDTAFCRGSAYVDLDNDGDLDLVFIPVNKALTPPVDWLHEEALVYYNETPNNNNWVKLKLEGTVSNRNAYGSHVFLYDSEGKVQLREVDGGSGHASSNTPIVHFGLGNASIDSIKIIWTNGIEQIVKDVEVNQQHHIIEMETIQDTTNTDTTVTSIVEQLDVNIAIYPNPVKDYLILDISKSISNYTTEIKLVSLDGKLLWETKADNFPIEINTTQWTSQNFFVNVYIDRLLVSATLINKSF